MINFISNLLGSVSEWRKYTRTKKELYAMTDRDLADMGISRGDIPYVAKYGNR
jgi:uncharacterized protein YjiS (DUF1127 family)